MMLLVFRDKRFMRVVLCFTGWAFAVNLASPFFNVLMLENLEMSYTRITLFNQIAQNICSVLFVRRWGRPLDRYGSKAVVQIAGRACMVLPLLWLFVTPSSQWIILIISVLTGIFWPAVDLGQQNSYLAASEEHHRAMYMAVFFAVYNLLGVAVGNALGGVLVQDVFGPLASHGFSLFGNVWTKYHFIILFSCLLRIAVVIGLFPILREEEGVPWRQALSIMLEEWRARLLRRHIAWQRNHLRRRARAQEHQLMEEQQEQAENAQEGGDTHEPDDPKA